MSGQPAQATKHRVRTSFFYCTFIVMPESNTILVLGGRLSVEEGACMPSIIISSSGTTTLAGEKTTSTKAVCMRYNASGGYQVIRACECIPVHECTRAGWITAALCACAHSASVCVCEHTVSPHRLVLSSRRQSDYACAFVCL